MNLIDHEKFVEKLPHGSGIDCNWEVFERKDGKTTFKNFFHAMDEHGYYDGYMPFQFTVSFNGREFFASLIRCNENKRRSFFGLKDSLNDTIDYAISTINFDQVKKED